LEGDIIVTIIVAVIGSQALSHLVDAFIQRVSKPSKLEEGVKWLLQDRLEKIMEHDIKAGQTNNATKAIVHTGYKIYHELKGNDGISIMLEDYDALEVVY